MKTIALTFDRDHTHAGQPIKRGEIRNDIPQSDAEWLIAQAIAHPTPSVVRARMAATNTPSDNATEETHHELD